jgi:hypothetical protein
MPFTRSSLIPELEACSTFRCPLHLKLLNFVHCLMYSTAIVTVRPVLIWSIQYKCSTYMLILLLSILKLAYKEFRHGIAYAT